MQQNLIFDFCTHVSITQMSTTQVSIAVHSLSIHLLLSSQQPRALPYIGAYLDQIYSLEMNVKTWNTDGLVNFAKMTKVKIFIRIRAEQIVHSNASILLQDEHCLWACVYWINNTNLFQS